MVSKELKTGGVSLVAAPKVSQSNRRKDGKDVNKQTMVKQKSTKSKPPNQSLVVFKTTQNDKKTIDKKLVSPYQFANKPPRKPPTNNYNFTFQYCDEYNENECFFSSGLEHLTNIIRQIFEALLSNPLKLPPLNHMLIQLIIASIVDEIIILLDSKNFHDETITLLKMTLSSIVINKGKLNHSGILIKFVAKKIRQDHFKLLTLDEKIKSFTQDEIKKITQNVKTKLRLMHLRQIS